MNRDSANESGNCSGPGSNTNAPVAPATASVAIPLPPPLPPAPRPRQAPPSAVDLPNQTALNESDPSFDEQTAITMSLSSGKALTSEPPATPPVPSFPCPMFFYGSLMDPEVLQTILGVEAAPPSSKGSIAGFKVKMWNIYPTLIPSTGGRVNGVVCTIAPETLFWRLVAYETKAYTWCRCRAILQDGSRSAADKAKEKLLRNRWECKD